jgi:hypothetical protein
VLVHGRGTCGRICRGRTSRTYGDYVLTSEHNTKEHKRVVYGHKLSSEGRLRCHDVRISERKHGTAVASTNGGLQGMFAYVETLLQNSLS